MPFVIIQRHCVMPAVVETATDGEMLGWLAGCSFVPREARRTVSAARSWIETLPRPSGWYDDVEAARARLRARPHPPRAAPAGDDGSDPEPPAGDDEPTGEPAASPGEGRPATAQPATPQPVSPEPAMTRPATAHPAMASPAMAHPAAAHPVSAHPAPAPPVTDAGPDVAPAPSVAEPPDGKAAPPVFDMAH